MKIFVLENIDNEMGLQKTPSPTSLFGPKPQLLWVWSQHHALPRLLTRHLAPVSIMLFGSCHLILFVSSTNYFQIVRHHAMPRLVRHGGGFRPTHLQGPSPPPTEGEADLHKGVQWICVRVFYRDDGWTQFWIFLLQAVLWFVMPTPRMDAMLQQQAKYVKRDFLEA